MLDDPFTSLLQGWGWVGILIYFFFRELWPSLRDVLVPSYIEEKKRKRGEEERRAEEEREMRQTLTRFEERQTIAFEKVGEAVQRIEQMLVAYDNRLGNVERDVESIMVSTAITAKSTERPTRPRKNSPEN